jgi:hypothetical protein
MGPELQPDSLRSSSLDLLPAFVVSITSIKLPVSPLCGLFIAGRPDHRRSVCRSGP